MISTVRTSPIGFVATISLPDISLQNQGKSCSDDLLPACLTCLIKIASL